jgi:hypothetical protein
MVWQRIIPQNVPCLYCMGSELVTQTVDWDRVSTRQFFVRCDTWPPYEGAKCDSMSAWAIQCQVDP